MPTNLAAATDFSLAFTAASSNPVARRGDQSPTVALLQRALVAAGIVVKGGADGVFGPGTEAAVRLYQQQRGLIVDGVATVATATALGMLPASPLLANGAHSADVMLMQQQLIAVGIAVRGGADGWYGSGTAMAVQAFQAGRGLTPSGNLDAATAEILTNAAAALSAPAPAAPLAATEGQLVFPVPATCKFWNTWGAPRSGGRTHQGVDIMAASGTPIVAVQTGTITKKQGAYRGSLAGNALWLTIGDGTYYFFAHLSAFANGIAVGSKVNSGEAIGFVGSTGNTSVAHLHFEVHPKGGAAVNPYPIVKAVSGC